MLAFYSNSWLTSGLAGFYFLSLVDLDVRHIRYFSNGKDRTKFSDNGRASYFSDWKSTEKITSITLVE